MTTKNAYNKKTNLDLNAFLHSVTNLPYQEFNKHSAPIIGDTNDVMFSLNNYLEFDIIINYNKLHVLSCVNGTILDITFKFMTGHNMRLIFDCFYAPRKKRRLLNYLNLMCEQNLFKTFNIKYYINFLFLFFYFTIFFFFLSIFFYFFFKKFVLIF
jgi:hypothetical protein